MSLLQSLPKSEFGPLFRLMDDYVSQGSGSFSSSSVRAFHPKFDVYEHKDRYELHGELPGINQKDINIEFADAHTLVVKGRVESEYSSDSANQAQGRITGEMSDHPASRKATVEDEGANNTTTDKGNEASKTSSDQKQVQKGGPRCWVSERSVGEFHRAFSFPTRVDQDSVKANLKNGVLTITVPKATAQQGKRIQVE